MDVGRMEVNLHAFFTYPSTFDEGEWSHISSGHFKPRGNIPAYSFYRKPNGTQSHLDAMV
jgi:hypothetical protein